MSNRMAAWFGAMVAATAWCPPVLAADGPPNVVLIVSDDQAWTDFGFMGHEVIKTPRLDKLAEESAVFTNGYVPTSLCRASLATLLTGTFAHQHKICCNDPPGGIDREAMHPFMQQAPAIPRVLAAQGYVSLQTGKFWEGHYSNAGFTSGMTTKGRHGEEGLVIGRKTMQPIFDFIRDRPAGKPYFVWYAPMLPHEPHNAPPRLRARYESPDRPLALAKYYANCEWLDETVGQLLDFLDQQPDRDNTLVIFVVDNGWIQETGPVRQTRGHFALKSKLSPYDGGLRTPVLIRWPGRVKPGRYNDLVSTVDIAPTIYAACGATLPMPLFGGESQVTELPGVSLLERAAGGEPLARDAVYGELFTHTSKDLDKPVLSLTHRWIRRGPWKLIVPVSGSPELYNIEDDPHEERNLAAAHAALVEELRQQLNAWWDARVPARGPRRNAPRPAARPRTS